MELRPKFSDSGYKRKVAYVEKKRYLVSKMKLYNRANQHIKTLTIDKFKQYKGRFWLPKKSVMANHKTKKSTVLNRESVDFRTRLPASDFTEASLKRIR